MGKRVFLIVLDSIGTGELPDAAAYGDAGSDTLGALISSGYLQIPFLEQLGYLASRGAEENCAGCFGKMAEKSQGKDTTTGHWEIAGLVVDKKFPTYPGGFPIEFLNEVERKTGIGWLCNKPYSGTQVIEDYGEEHVKTGKMIVYTSADSVYQAAAHEEIIPLQKLYAYCETVRGMSDCGRIIARPFLGKPGEFYRTRNRHDFSLQPFKPTLLDVLKENGFETRGIGKIGDIFAHRGFTSSTPTQSNDHGMIELMRQAGEDFTGLCFLNLVDFDMLYGHRNDVKGYVLALNRFDAQLTLLSDLLGDDDMLIITADHGCDPSTPSTDHSREYVPLLVCGSGLRRGVDLGVRGSFADVAATVCDYFGVSERFGAKSFLSELV